MVPFWGSYNLDYSTLMSILMSPYLVGSVEDAAVNRARLEKQDA